MSKVSYITAAAGGETVSAAATSSFGSLVSLIVCYFVIQDDQSRSQNGVLDLIIAL
ncbi:hypothetical protein BVC80_1285g3 [Macleaya cordata]|uniref:Uncharacterized protein n=1 Tax=Macleaya cordata TaxID=56857 RepID=A0A200Q9T6_MACCD|nr:hypothetical protein BVC80_1285g3 [Macleaya cordata]